MSKSKTDSIRDRLDIVSKPLQQADKDDKSLAPIDGCKYYGDLKLMAKFCPHCRDRDCY